MNVKRMEAWAKLLESDAWKKDKVGWDMGDYVFEDDGRGDGRDCGFAACALGHAGLHGPFRKQGLVTELMHFRVVFRETPKGIGYEGVHAARMFFGLTDQQAASIVYPSSYEVFSDEITPAMVAKHVRDLIDEYKAENAYPD